MNPLKDAKFLRTYTRVYVLFFVAFLRIMTGTQRATVIGPLHCGR